MTKKLVIQFEDALVLLYYYVGLTMLKVCRLNHLSKMKINNKQLRKFLLLFLQFEPAIYPIYSLQIFIIGIE